MNPLHSNYTRTVLFGLLFLVGCARPANTLTQQPTSATSSGDDSFARLTRIPRIPSRSAPVVQASARSIATSTEGPQGAARREQLQTAVQRSGVSAACWQDAVAHLPEHRPERVTVQVEVDATGRAQTVVDGAQDPRLARCLRLRLSARSYGPGSAEIVESTWQFALNN